MSIEVLNESGQRARRQAAGGAGRFVMDRMRVHPLAELCIKAVDEDTIAELNEQWMDKEGPTDVLAFPMDELRPGLVNEEPEEGVLGDLVLCPEVAERQAETAGHPTEAEIELLTVHGILHLLGYDHAEPEEHAGDVRSPGRAAGAVARGHRARPAGMSSADLWLLLTAALLVLAAGLFSAADAALAVVLARPAPRSCRGPRRARQPRGSSSCSRTPRATSTPRCCCACSCEISAIVLVTLMVDEAWDGAWWPMVLTSVAAMLVVSFVVIGVAPRTLGRQHDERVALLSAGPADARHPDAGPAAARC